jgi:hypothetical protein
VNRQDSTLELAKASLTKVRKREIIATGIRTRVRVGLPRNIANGRCDETMMSRSTIIDRQCWGGGGTPRRRTPIVGKAKHGRFLLRNSRGRAGVSLDHTLRCEKTLDFLSEFHDITILLR